MDDIPTSSGVSEEVVKKTSPNWILFCDESISIDSRKLISAIGLLNIFKYGRNLASPCPKSLAVFPERPVNVFPISPSLRCSQVIN